VNFNRNRNRKIKELLAREQDLRAKLLANEQDVAAADRKIAEVTVEVKGHVEEYIDALAQAVDADERRVVLDSVDSVKLHALLVGIRWHGVETVEQAAEELDQEVAHRSVSKTDVAVLLSSVDHTAFSLHDTLPEHLAHLHGEALVDGIEKTLKLEDFAATLVQDKNWVEMRRRWVRLGWRGAADETFNATFVRAVAERVAEVHNKEHPVLDTVLDKLIKRVSPSMRDQMMKAFQVRLDREYALLPKRKDYEVDVTLDGEDLKRLDAVVDRWGTTRSGAMSRIVREAVKEHLPQVDVGEFQKLIGNNELVNPFRSGGYSDHDLMRTGRVVWEQSYALGWSDERLRDEIANYFAIYNDPTDGSRWPDDLILFAAKWAVHAFQRLITSHTFAAALMCSDVQKEVLDGIEKQWDGFLVIVPNGMLLSGKFEFSRILVSTCTYGARMILLTTGGPELHLPRAQTMSDEAPTLADLLASDEGDLIAHSPTQRCLVMAKRLVAGLLLNLQHEPNFKIRAVEARPKSKKREAEPEHRIVTIGQPIEIDCRDSVKEYIEHGKHGRRHGPPTVQVMVRGHYRRQVCGVGRMERKTIWIQPFWRGPEAALIQTRASKVALS
jgi:hypothetical protein